MKRSLITLLAGVLIATSACSAETVKRTTYETLQNIVEAQCQEDLSTDCTGRVSYETYKRKTGTNKASED